MKPECEAAVRAAAGDRQLTKADFEAIQERLRGATKQFKRQNPEVWARMSPSERLLEAAKLAHAGHLESLARSHEAAIQNAHVKATNDALINAVPAGMRLRALFSHAFIDHQGGTSIESSVRALRNLFHRMFTDRNSRVLDDPVKSEALAQELFGQDSGDAEAKAAAQEARTALDNGHAMANRSGVRIGYLENYHLPQPWDWTRLSAEDRETWIQKMLQRLDLREFVNPDGTDMSPEQIRHTLEESWLTLQTNGANKRAARDGSANYSGGVGRRHNAPRQLHFKDAKAWLDTMREYGTSDNVGSILREHFNRLSRDIAVARAEGSNADANFKQRATRALADDLTVANSARAKRAAEAKYHQILGMWEVLTRGHSPGNSVWAARLGAVRSVLSASKLGTLVSQQPSDTLMALNYLKRMGFDTNGFGTAAFKGLAGKDRKAWMRRVGVWADNAHDVTSRFGDTEVWNKTSKFMNGTVYKYAGMRAADRFTTSGIAENFYGTLGRRVTKYAKFEDMPQADRDLLARYGITQQHWDVLRNAEIDRGFNDDRTNLTPDGIYDIPNEKLRPLAEASLAAKGGKPTESAIADETARLKDDTVLKIQSAFQTVLHPAGRGFSGSTLKEQSRLGLLNHASGSFMGEAVRMLWLIRQVPMGMMMTHLHDVPAGMEGWRPRTNYIAHYMLGQAAATAVMVEAKHWIAGEDPENIFTLPFAGKLLAGAGLGPLLATILFGSGNEEDDSDWLGKLSGPAGDVIDKLARLTVEGRDAVEGQAKHFDAGKYESQWISFIRSNLVPFMNFWYTKAAFNHLIYQQLQEQVSPGYNRRVQKAIHQRDKNRSMWWQQGQPLPSRAPDMGAAVGQPNQ